MFTLIWSFALWLQVWYKDIFYERFDGVEALAGSEKEHDIFSWIFLKSAPLPFSCWMQMPKFLAPKTNTENFAKIVSTGGQGYIKSSGFQWLNSAGPCHLDILKSVAEPSIPRKRLIPAGISRRGVTSANLEKNVCNAKEWLTLQLLTHSSQREGERGRGGERGERDVPCWI
jgi:hypothetical protein